MQQKSISATKNNDKQNTCKTCGLVIKYARSNKLTWKGKTSIMF